MNRPRPIAAVILLTSLGCWPGLAAQAVAPGEGLDPFRRPGKVVEFPPDLYRELTIMQRVADSGRHPLHFDEAGRQICDNEDWRAAYARIKPRLAERNTAAMLHIMQRDSLSEDHRGLAAYGTFFLADPSNVFHIMALFPAEPARHIREASFERSVPFIRAHLRENREQPPTDKDGEQPAQSKYTFIAYPFLKLLEVGDDRDRAKSLWLLKETVLVRPDFASTLLEAARPMLDKLALSDDASVRSAAWDFVHQCDPARRPLPQPGTEDAIVRVWLQAILYDAFPPIRPVSQGRTDLYPSEDLEQVVAVGTRELRGDAIGEPFHGKQRNGQYYRGFRVTRLPKPLDKLRIPLDAVILNVNGSPVATATELIDAVRTHLELRPTLMVEFLDRGGQNRMMEYRLREKGD